ncbi:MAG: FHA domain-containing protein [Thermoguttaceae bacterium]|nr:FHA domain-containing protein [Thermoguttaceae bacterium]
MDSLFVIQGYDQGNRFALDDETATIGRDASNKIRLRDAEVSRRHAEIRRGVDGITLVDLESSNGVYVNGPRIKTRRILNGDQNQIGRTVLLFSSRVSDVGSREPLVDVFQEAEGDGASQVLHALEPDENRVFPRSSSLAGSADDVKSAWLEKARAHLNFMYHATLAASRTLDVERLLDRILELIFQWAPVDRGCVFLYDADADKLVPKSSRTRKTGGRVQVSQTILNYTFKNRKGILTSNARCDERWNGSVSVLDAGVKEAICVPMQGRYGLVGVLYVDVSRRRDNWELADAPSSDSRPVSVVPSAEPSVAPSLRSGISAVSPDERFFAPTLDADSLGAPVFIDGDADSGSRSFEIYATDDALYSNAAPADACDGRASKKLTLDHLKLMIAIGCQAALAIEDAQYYVGLAQAERLAAIGQTVAALSHHIKNILQGIRGGSYLIDAGLKDHDENLVAKGWRIVEKNQTKISDLVLDMLTFSKERVPVWSFADFNEVMEDVVELTRGRADDLDVELVFFPDASIPRFYFDKEQIHRAVVNLIGNAIEASKDYDPDAPPRRRTPSDSDAAPSAANNDVASVSAPKESASEPEFPRFPRGRVEARTRFDADEKRVFVIVDDVGPGVSPANRDAIFRPFASKNKSGGTGLGLPVTPKIVREHQGKIVVDDSPLGGARFVVELPLVLEKKSDDDSDVF